jgi:hypothetical protein
VTADNLVTFLVIALFLFGSSIVSAIARATRGKRDTRDRSIAAPPNVTRSGVAQPSAERRDAASAPLLTAAQAERVRMIEAQLARRGITPPPALQAVVDAFEAAAVPPSPPAAAPVSQSPQPQQQSHRHRHHHQPASADAAQRQTVPVARSAGVPLAAAQASGMQAGGQTADAWMARMQASDVPVGGDLDTPPSAPSPARRLLATAFADPAHARNAVVLTEILGPPVALR